VNPSKGKKKASPRVKGERRKGGGWGWLFVKIVALILVAGGAYIGWTWYKSNKRHSRFD